MGEVTLEEIMNVNDTVMSMVSTINELEHTLRDSWVHFQQPVLSLLASTGA